MLNQIATIFEGAVNRINLVNQYDGVVQRITVDSKGQNGTIRETFPVSCTDPTACNNQRYRKAVPDEALQGLAYVEQRGNPTVGPYESWGYTLSYPVRLVLWINAGKNNLSNCGDAVANAELLILNCLRHPKEISVDFSTKDIPVNVELINILEKNPGQIFQGLAYNDKQALYFWPYAFTAMDFNVVFHIPANCIDEIPVPMVEDCVTH